MILTVRSKMKFGECFKRVCSAIGILFVGIALLVESNSLAHHIDHSPIPDAMDRWGPDGYSYGHSFLVIFGSVGVLVVSVVVELLVWSVSERGLNPTRWLMVFSVGVLLLGAALIWIVSQEVRTATQSEQVVRSDAFRSRSLFLNSQF